MAEQLTKGAGDGRLSKDDAIQLIKKVKDANTYTAIEKNTVAYIRKNYKWTEIADEWFRAEIRKWAGTK